MLGPTISQLAVLVSLSQDSLTGNNLVSGSPLSQND